LSAKFGRTTLNQVTTWCCSAEFAKALDCHLHLSSDVNFLISVGMGRGRLYWTREQDGFEHEDHQEQVFQVSN
jgi:hypothetical protein